MMGGEFESVDQKPGSLRLVIDDAFTLKLRSIAEAMSYQFNPERKLVHCRGLSFEVVLNAARLTYVRNTLEKLRNSNHISESHSAIKKNTKHSLQPHQPVPGDTSCSLCAVEVNPLLIKNVELGRKQYALVMNKRPWGFHNFMLVTIDAQPQAMTRTELLASFELLKHLGSDYEGIFTGVGAGASVYHFHLQVHKGSAMIWRHLESGSIKPLMVFSSNGVTVKSCDGWPARVFFFEGASFEGLATTIQCMIETLAKGDNDFPYNIGFRYSCGGVQLILIPRSGIEQPTCILGHPNSWGRFGFLEMAGSVFLLSPTLFETIEDSAESIYEAIEEMSIGASQEALLINAFRESVANLR